MKNKNKIIRTVEMLFAFLVYLIPFLSTKNIIFKSSYYLLIFNICTLSYATFISIQYILRKDSFEGTYLLLLYPFTFASGFSLDTVPVGLLIAIGVIVIGMIAHMVIYKPKLKFGKMTFGILLYGVALALGGIASKTTSNYPTLGFKPIQIVFILVGVLITVLVMIFVVSTAEGSFDQIANSFLLLGTLILLQTSLYFMTYQGTLNDYLENKPFYLGWGIHNSVAIMLLFCAPFAIYKASKDHSALYLILYIVMGLAIGVTLSKGAMLSFAVMTPFLWVTFFIFSKKNKQYLYTSIIVIVLFALLLALGVIFKKESLQALLSGFSFNTIFTRQIIWKNAWSVFEKNAVFGIGLFGGLTWNVEAGSYYQFVHNTFLQMMLSSGVMGLLALIYHMVEKYVQVLYHPNREKICLFFVFLMPGLYGLIDVTYLFVNFFISLVLLLSLSNFLFENEKYTDIFFIKRSEK